jgi:hypothetical protein
LEERRRTGLAVEHFGCRAMFGSLGVVSGCSQGLGCTEVSVGGGGAVSDAVDDVGCSNEIAVRDRA